MDYTQLIVALDTLALVAAIAMFVQAFRAHRSISTRSSLAFLTCFALIVVGILARIGVDSLSELTFTGLLQGVAHVALTPKLFLLISALCILSGYMLLLLVVENIKQPSMWAISFLLLIMTVALASDLFAVTHIIAVALLALLAHRFYTNFLTKNSTNALLVYIAFMILVAGHVAALLIGLSPLWQVAYLVMRIIGFFVLFVVSWRVSRG